MWRQKEKISAPIVNSSINIKIDNRKQLTIIIAKFR